MACKRYTVNEVVAELDGSDFEDSEDDFDFFFFFLNFNENVHGTQEK